MTALSRHASPAPWWRLHRYTLLLLLTLILGGTLQTIVAIYAWGDAGEGQYLQAALSVSRGGIPLVTFPSRPEPMNQLVMVPAIWLFGSGLEVGRSMIVLLNVITAGTIALIARRLSQRHGDVAALATAGIYLMAPLAATQGVLIDEEPVAAVFLALSLYFLLRERWSGWRWNYPLAGLLLGLAILSRRSAVAVGVVWLLWIFYQEKGWRRRVLTAVRCFSPGIAVTVGFFLYVASRTSLPWAMTAFFDTSSTYAQLVIPWPYRVGIVSYLLIVATPLFLAPLALVPNTLRGKGKTRSWEVSILAISLAVAAFLILYPSVADYGLTEDLTPFLIPLVVLTVALSAGLMVWESRPSRLPAIQNWDFLLLVAGWAIAFFGFDFLQRTQPFASYSGDALAPLAILFGLWFATLVPAPGPAPSRKVRLLSMQTVERYGGPIALVFLLVLSSSFVTVWMIGPTSAQNGASYTELRGDSIYRYPPSELAQVGTYLNGAMRTNDTIFTFDTLFADAAGRTISPEMAQYIDPYLDYLGLNAGGAGAPVNPIPPGASNQSPYPDAPAGFIPSTEGLMAYWNETHLEWLVEGYVTQAVLTHSALLNWYVETYFHPVRSFGDPFSYDEVVVFQRGALPPLQQTLVAGTKPSLPPAASVSFDGRMYVAYANSSELTYLNVSGANGTIPIPFGGSTSLGLFFGNLWVGSATTPQVEVLPLDGGSSEILDVGMGPFTFASDSASGEVFVGANGSTSITGIKPASNHTWWDVGWSGSEDTPITSLAANSTSHLLYAAAPSKDALLILDDRDGATTQIWQAPFTPSLIAYVDGGLIAAWHGGLVYRLNLTNGTNPEVLGQTYVGGGINDLVEVPSLDALAIAREESNTTTFVDARTLFILGSFSNIACPTSLVWDAASGYLGTANQCTSYTAWWRLPPYAELTLTGPPGASVNLNYDPLATYVLPLTFHAWPQWLALTTLSPGFLPGFKEITFSSNVSVVVTLGPSLAGIGTLESDFLIEIAVASTLAFMGGVSLIVWGDRLGGDIAPRREMR